ncbi:MAG: DUF2344 domain-containing protein, partial [Nitrospinaceae bacterium]|nr:DUF2344 domain-containing protein [Nitrospinaceae bacterium]
VTKEYQLAEWNRSLREITVGDCRYESCGQCGILDNYKGVKYHYEKPMPPLENRLPLIGDNKSGTGYEPVELSIIKEQKIPAQQKSRKSQGRRQSEPSGPVPVGFEDAANDNPALAALQPDVPVSRFRFMFEKWGDMRFLSHLEILRTFSRAIQRAGLRVEHTRGFNPHPKIVFSSALPVGVESRAEFVDIPLLETDGEFRILDVFRAIQNALPEGLRPWAAWKLAPGAKGVANSLLAAVYEIKIELDERNPAHQDNIEAAVLGVMASESIEMSRIRKGKTIIFDARPAIAGLETGKTAQGAEGKSFLELYLTLRYGDGTKPKVFDILATCLGLSPEECLRTQIRKIGVQRKAGLSRALENVI